MYHGCLCLGHLVGRAPSAPSPPHNTLSRPDPLPTWNGVWRACCGSPSSGSRLAGGSSGSGTGATEANRCDDGPGAGSSGSDGQSTVCYATRRGHVCSGGRTTGGDDRCGGAACPSAGSSYCPAGHQSTTMDAAVHANTTGRGGGAARLPISESVVLHAGAGGSDALRGGAAPNAGLVGKYKSLRHSGRGIDPGLLRLLSFSMEFSA